MAGTQRQAGRIVITLETLAKEPWQFDLLDTLRWFERTYSERPRIGSSTTRAEEIVFLGQEPYLEFPASNVAAFDKDWGGRGKIASRFLGLLGLQGALPLEIAQEAKHYADSGDDALVQFLDLFNRRRKKHIDRRVLFNVTAKRLRGAVHDVDGRPILPFKHRDDFLECRLQAMAGSDRQ